MVFDSWGGVLADGAQTFSPEYTAARAGPACAPGVDGQDVPRTFHPGGGRGLDDMNARP